MKQKRRNVNPSIYLADSLEITNLEKICSHLSRERAKRRFLFFVSFSWFCFLFCFVLFFVFFAQRAIRRRRKKSNGHSLRFYITLEILFWLKKKLSEGRGLFRGNVFKNSARYRNVKLIQNHFSSFFILVSLVLLFYLFRPASVQRF